MKNALFVDFANDKIVMTTTFAKKCQNTASAEYAQLQSVRRDYPTHAVTTRQIKSNPHKDTYKGLTYEWMQNHIATHEPKEVVEEKLNAFDEMVYISKCHRGSLRYPTIKKWFLKEYPNVAKFGTVELPEEAQEEETKAQSVIPMPESQTEDDVA